MTEDQPDLEFQRLIFGNCSGELAEFNAAVIRLFHAMGTADTLIMQESEVAPHYIDRALSLVRETRQAIDAIGVKVAEMRGEWDG